jgi:hypothetical protein
MGNLGTALALGGQLFDLALAQGDEGDFGGNEEASEGDQKGNNANIAKK